MVSLSRIDELIGALRRGSVPQAGLDLLAVGLSRHESTVADELAQVASGRGHFKAVRGDYGCGKTFFGRWLQEQARGLGFATSEVQISETETPLHRMETVYRRLCERLVTSEEEGAFRGVIDGWFYTLEQDVLADGQLDPADAEALVRATDRLMEQRLAEVTRVAPAFSATLRAYRLALLREEAATAEGLIAWIAGQPTVAAAVKRTAGIRGAIDHFGASSTASISSRTSSPGCTMA